MTSKLVPLALLALAPLAFAQVDIGLNPAQSDTKPNEGLAPVRAEQKFTTNALIGYVNSEPIFVMDMLRPINDELTRLSDPKSGRDINTFKIEARRAIEAQLKRHVSDTLLLANARTTISEEDTKKIDMFMNKERNDLLAKYGGSQATADAALRAVGSSFDKELQDKRRRVMTELLLHRELMPRIVVTRPMILEEYKRNTAKYSQDAEVDLHTITIPVGRFLVEKDPLNPEKDRRIKDPTPERIRSAEIEATNAARDLLNRIKKGEKFAELAGEYSADSRKNNGGRWPRIKKGALADQSLENYAFTLKSDSLGEPLLIRDADDPFKSKVVIVKVGEVKQAKTLSFEEVQDKIRDDLRNKQYNEMMTDYYNKLYKKAAIEAVDRMVDVCLEVAVTRYAVR